MGKKEEKTEKELKDKKEIKEKKNRALNDAIKAIEKTYGKGAVMKLGDRAAVDVDTIPTGSLLLNNALGVGGYPKGRIIEIYGPESSGKTTLTLHAIAEVQKQGGTCAFIDAEHAIDPIYAKNLGVNIEELILSQPDSGEQGLEIAETLVRSGAIDLVVVDSVAALVPQMELDGDIGDQQMGLQARLMSKALRKLSGVMNKTDCTIIFINQLREKIGTMYGNPETTTGGRALKFYSSIRLEIRKKEVLKNGSEIIGAKTRIKVTKNKVAPPFKEILIDILFGKGIDSIGEILDLAVEKDIIDKSGAWYSYKGEKIGQGRENTKNYLANNKELLDEYRSLKDLADKIKNYKNTELKEKLDTIKKEKNSLALKKKQLDKKSEEFKIISQNEKAIKDNEKKLKDEIKEYEQENTLNDVVQNIRRWLKENENMVKAIKKIDTNNMANK